MANSIQIRGLAEAKAAFQQMPETFRDALNSATELTVREIVRNAKARVLASPSVQTRSLLNHITFSMNTTTGRGRAGVSAGSTRIGGVRVKGLVTAKTKANGQVRIINPARYAHFVEFGTIKMPAEPFMIPATEGQKTAYLDRCRAAGRTSEQRLSNIGSRNL